MTVQQQTLPALTSPPSPLQRAPASDARLSEAVRAAVVLTALEPSVAASVLSGFSDSRLRSFARAMTQIGQMHARDVDDVLRDFLRRLLEDSGMEGGEVEARRYLSAFMEADAVDDLMDDVTAPPQSVWSRLADLPDEALVSWLGGEHPQVAAVALTKLSTDKSASLLEQLEPGTAQNVVIRMGQAPQADQAAVERIADVIERDVLPRATAAASKVNPAAIIATVLNQVSGRVRDDLMAHMRTSSTPLADDVRRLMFTFEDIPARVDARDIVADDVRRLMFTFEDIPARVDARDIALVMKGVDDAQLLLALKPAGVSEILEFFLGNMTKRMAERLNDEIKDLAEPEISVAEAAQSAVIKSIVDLRDSGAIELKTPTVES